MEKERIPPHQWAESPDPDQPKKRALWWLQNPSGKNLFFKFLERASSNKALVLKSIHTKALADMTRISAELHLNYSSDKPVKEILNSLEGYRQLLDPCSGKPYIWNDQKQILYSLGIDRDDDGGKGDPITSFDTDYAIPIVLFLK